MILHVEWGRPVPLKDASKENMIYGVNLYKLTDSAGVNIFGRRWGNQFEALYIGKAGNIRGRIKNHLNNLHLMQHLRNAKTGRRVVLAGVLHPKPGQNLQKAMALAERALIRHFLSEGHDLVNKLGMRLRTHELNSFGNYPKRFIQKEIYLERAKGE
jgi:hypothetical protein